MKKNPKRMAPAAKEPATPTPVPAPQLPVDPSSNGKLPDPPKPEATEPLFRAFDHVGGGRMELLRDVEHLRMGMWEISRLLNKAALGTSILLQGLTLQETLRSLDWRPEQCLAMPAILWAECELFFSHLEAALLAMGGQPRFAKTTTAIIDVMDHLRSLCYAKELTNK